MPNLAVACRRQTYTTTSSSAMSGSCRLIGFSTACQGSRKDGNCRALPDSPPDFRSRWVTGIHPVCAPSLTRRQTRTTQRRYARETLLLLAALPPICRISWDRFTPTTRATPLTPILIRVHLLQRL